MSRRRFTGGLIPMLAGAANVRVVNRPARNILRPKPRIDYIARRPPVSTTPIGFPHPYVNTIIASTTVTGDPLWNSTTEVWNETYLERCSHYPYVEIPMYGFTVLDKPAGWVVADKIHAYNPRCKVAWYTQGVIRGWDVFSAQRLSDRLYRLMIGPPTRYFTISAAGQAYFDSTIGVGLHPYLTGSGFFTGAPSPKFDGACTDLAATLATNISIFQDHAAVANVDGWHWDWAAGNIANLNNPTVPVIDLASASGYVSVAALNAANVSALDSLMNALKLPGQMLIGNRGNGSSSYHPDANVYAGDWTGELFEGWDPGQGIVSDKSWPLSNVSFAGAMTRLAHWRGATPDADGGAILKYEFSAGGASIYNANWNKLNRYGLGSASIMGCYGFISSATNLTSPYHVMWVADEFSVDSSATTDLAMNNMGWLGRPIEFGWQYATNVWVRRFERGAVIVNMADDGTSSPTWGGSVTVTLGSGYRRIQGVRDTVVNNGAASSTFTVPFKDAVFLHTV